MIYACACSVRDQLKAAGFPIAFRYGTDRVALDRSASLLVAFDRDFGAPDIVSPPRGSKSNPRYVARRKQSGIVHIYAQSGVAGARQNEHEALCDLVVDAVIVALHTWCSANVHVLPTIGVARYLAPEDLDDREAWPGVVYQLGFSFDRAVLRRTFVGGSKDTAAIAAIDTEIEIS